MKRKILNSFVAMGIIFYLGGCTSLKNYFGKRDIKSATTIYNKEGITLNGVKKLADGIEAIPDSQEGLSLFNVQFTEIISEKNRILKKEKISKEDIDVKKLADGIEAIPDSQEGLSLFNVQFTEIISEKNRILKKEKISKEDIEKLTIFIYIGEKAGELVGKVPNIVFNRDKYLNSKKEIINRFERYILDEDYNTYSREDKIRKIKEGKVPNIVFNRDKYLNSKKEIINRFERYILDEDYNTYSREDKIRKIKECKHILKYVSSPKIYTQKLKLEEEVTIDVSIVSTRLGYDTLSNVIRGELYKLSTENKNLLLDDYIYFRGYGKDIETDYLVELELFKENVYTKRVAIEENENKEKVFIKEKEVVLEGYYNLINENKEKVFIKEKEVVLEGYYNLIKLSDRKVLNRRPFKVNKNYSIKTVQGDNQLLFDSEREIVEKVIDEELKDIFIRDINFLISDSNL